MQRLAVDLFEKVLEYNGTISATRGDGLSRSWFLRRQYGKLNGVFSEIKDMFDPGEIINSGKVASHRFSGLVDNLRSHEITVGAKANSSIEANVDSDRSKTKLDDDGQLPDLDAASEVVEESTTAIRTQKPAKKSVALPVITPELNWSLESMAAAAPI